MTQEIEFALREAYTMQLGEEQSIKFVMRMAKVDRDTAARAVKKYNSSVIYSH